MFQVYSGEVWFGITGFGILLSVLVWFGWFWISFEIQLSTVWLSLVWCGSLVLVGLVLVSLVWLMLLWFGQFVLSLR